LSGLNDTGQKAAGICAYQIAAAVLVRTRFLVEAADGKAGAAVRLAVFRQVAPCYWQVVDNPATTNDNIYHSAVSEVK